jgi:hypothetical protein
MQVYLVLLAFRGQSGDRRGDFVVWPHWTDLSLGNLCILKDCAANPLVFTTSTLQLDFDSLTIFAIATYETFRLPVHKTSQHGQHTTDGEEGKT